MLDVLLNLDVDAELLQSVGVSGQRAVADTLDGLLLALVDDVSLDLGGIRLVLRGIDSQGNLLEWSLAVQVLTCEDVPNRLGVDLAALGVGDCLHDRGELNLHGARQVHAVVRLHDVGHAALARLGVHANNGLVRTTNVLRVDGQVRNLPGHRAQVLVGKLLDSSARADLVCHCVEALVHCVLVRAGESGEDQVAAVRVALRNAQLVAVLDGTADQVDVGEINLRVDTLGQHVQAQGDQADVTGALAVAEEAALDAVGAGHVAQLGGGDAGTAVVVRVQRQNDGVAAVEVAVHPLDGVCVDVRSDHLHGRRQVDDDWVLRRRVDDINHGIDNFLGVLNLGAGVGLRRVLPTPVGVRVVLRDGLNQLRGVGGNLLDCVLVLTEHNIALQDRGGVVEVNDDVLSAGARLEGAADQVLASLNQNLDGDVVRDHVLLNDLAHEVVIGLGSGRESDLNFLVAHLNQQLEHPALALRAHRINQRLVAIAQVDGTPNRCLSNALVRPGAVLQLEVLNFLGVRQVAVGCHLGVALLIPSRLAFRNLASRSGDYRRSGNKSVGGGHVEGLSNSDFSCRPAQLTPRRGAGLKSKPRRGIEVVVRVACDVPYPFVYMIFIIRGF